LLCVQYIAGCHFLNIAMRFTCQQFEVDLISH